MFQSPYFCCAHIKVLLLLIFVCGLILYFSTSESEYEVIKRCYLHTGRNPNDTGEAITYFEDLLTSEKQPIYDQGIFFIQTKCSRTGIADLKPRYACSIETVARANPEREVFMVFASPVGLRRHERDWSSTLKTLMEYPNIHFRNVQLQRLCANTPLEDWIETSELFKSKWPYAHSSDVFRSLLIYRYGGTYLDLDFMILRPLEEFGRNWIGIQTENCLNGAAFDFRRSGIGHIVLNEVLSDLTERYRPDNWDNNGPRSFQRVITKICNGTDLTQATRKQCRGVKIQPAKWLYPLYGDESFKFFNPDITDEVANMVKEMRGFHYYNSESRKIINITMGNGAAYDLIAKKYCPQIYAKHDTF